MLSYDMSKRGNASRYDYLYRRIRHDIAHGNILPDEKLPSKRALARSLGVSVITLSSSRKAMCAQKSAEATSRANFPPLRAAGNVTGSAVDSAAETTCAGLRRLAASLKTRFGGPLLPLRA